jgi:signal transduction histidine kinase
MAAPPAGADPDLAANQGTAAALDFAVTRLLRDDSPMAALPAVLGRLAGAFGLRGAVAFQPPSGTRPASILAAHPADGASQGLLSLISEVPAQRPVGAVVAFAPPVNGDCLCAVALIGDSAGDEARSAAHAVATLVAARIRDTGDDLIVTREQNDRLRELDEARNQFVAMVSHELRTPLTSIVSFSELIRGEAQALTPDGLRFLDIIDRNADRLLRLTGDLLLLSRLEAGEIPLDLGPVAIPGLVKEAANAASATAASQDIDIGISSGTGPPVTGDFRRLLQVLDNLLSNAVKFSHLHGHVHVTASHDGEQWRIDVADAGIGIPPGEADRLFGRFIRASNAQTSGLPGAGLGLSIVKAIVELHGGHVELEAAPDRGTTFSVFLPARP